MQSIRECREFLKDTLRMKVDFRAADQSRGVPPPPIQNPPDPAAPRYDLPLIKDTAALGRIDLFTAINNRQSRRKFRGEPLSLEELSFLLWATQGIHRVVGGSSLRTVPSAGARHAFETYIYARRVEGLEEAIYRYLPLDHELVEVRPRTDPGESLSHLMGEASLGQVFTGKSAATFVWTAVPYRMEWRYLQSAHKVIAIDAGHVCQNLYLACESIGAGTCAVAAYDQARLDALLGVDGEEEFAIYLAPVGKV
jgi:SagB-type dehydrogenase family enzyme